MTTYQTKVVQGHGFRQLDPVPSRADLDRFFSEQYYHLVEQGKRAVDIGRTRRGGDEAGDQARWFAETVHRDLIDLILEHAPGRKAMEIGCGLGNLLHDMRAAGLEPLGVDLAPEAVAAVQARGLAAVQGTLDVLVAEGRIAARASDAVVFNNVLELTHDPLENLRAAAAALKPGGLLVVRGGNDFNPLQLAASEALGLPQWWVSPPEHVSYLNYDAVESMMLAVGVEPLHRHGEFPMELWLLLGFDYISDRTLGADCHNRRVALERALPTEVRRRLYRAFGAAGLGRTMVVAGRLKV